MGENASDTPKKNRLKTLGIRALSGLALVGICGLPIYWGGWAMIAMLVVFGIRIAYEWVRMTDKDAKWPAYLLPVLGIIGTLVLLKQGYIQYAFAAVAVLAGLALIERLRRGGAGWALFGVVYVLLPGLAIYWLRGGQVGVHASGFARFMFVLLIVIAADTFAYLGGSTFGGPKLAPKISPNKTWSGFVSGLVTGAVTGAILAKISGFSLLMGAMLAVPIVLMAVAGDFLESWIKRRLGVKDAGALLPGHGGLLDRVDSLMLATVFAAGLLYFWPSLWPLGGQV